MLEIDRVEHRCTNCGQAIVLSIVWSDLDEDGNERKGIRTERIPHGRQECERMLKLERETWPTLF